MNTIDSARVGTPRAAATSGSRLAKFSGRQTTAKITSTLTQITVSQASCGSSTATICPVSKPNLLAALPSYRASAKMPRPRPAGINTATIELRSLAFAPSAPMMNAAAIEPSTDPNTTFTPASSAKAAPAKLSSLIPCTAKDISRFMTKMPIRPPTSASSAPAMSELATNGISWS